MKQDSTNKILTLLLSLFILVTAVSAYPRLSDYSEGGKLDTDVSKSKTVNTSISTKEELTDDLPNDAEGTFYATLEGLDRDAQPVWITQDSGAKVFYNGLPNGEAITEGTFSSEGGAELQIKGSTIRAVADEVIFDDSVGSVEVSSLQAFGTSLVAKWSMGGHVSAAKNEQQAVEYIATLIESDTNTIVEVAETDSLSHSFDDLKPYTSYYLEVLPLQREGARVSVGMESNILTATTTASGEKVEVLDPVKE